MQEQPKRNLMCDTHDHDAPQQQFQYEQWLPKQHRSQHHRHPSTHKSTHANQIQTSSNFHLQHQIQQPQNHIFFSKKSSAHLPHLSSNSSSNIEVQYSNQKSQEIRQKYKVTHHCRCIDEEECRGMHCVCALTPGQICLQGQCCAECLQKKNSYLGSVKGWKDTKIQQNQQDWCGVDRTNKSERKQRKERVLTEIRTSSSKNMYYFMRKYPRQSWLRRTIFCTCQKSHCQKNYCLCYRSALGCGQFCSCHECHNQQDPSMREDREQRELWEQYMRQLRCKQKEQVGIFIDHDIGQYLESGEDEEMEVSGEMEGGKEGWMEMEFEAPSFEREEAEQV